MYCTTSFCLARPKPVVKRKKLSFRTKRRYIGYSSKSTDADVRVVATLVYFYCMDAQVKMFIDRCLPRYRLEKGILAQIGIFGEGKGQ